jgi:AraC-like DNA-binding protein
VEYWRHVLDETVGPLDPVGVPDQLRVGEVGAVRVAELSQRESGGARRTTRHARLLDLDVCKIDVVAEGRGLVQQDGREARLGPGDVTFVDLSRPARWTMSPVRMAAMVFPRALLPLPADGLARLTAVRIPGDHGTGALVSSLARQLTGHLDELSPVDGARLGGAMVDLLTTALAARLEHPVPADTRQRALLVQMHAFIERHLGDPRLTPDAIAAAHHVSVRYLYTLFASEGQSVAAWVRQRRLERCRHDLRDPGLRDQPVSAIAARWGLPNAAHFSRAFRAAYGVSPVEYRAGGDPSAPA